MTLTIDLSPTEQARLTAAARQSGLAPDVLAKRLVTDHLPPVISPPDEEDRVARIRAGMGRFAHVNVTVEDLHRERQADKAAEESAAAGDRG